MDNQIFQQNGQALHSHTFVIPLIRENKQKNKNKSKLPYKHWQQKDNVANQSH